MGGDTDMLGVPWALVCVPLSGSAVPQYPQTLICKTASTTCRRRRTTHQ